MAEATGGARRHGVGLLVVKIVLGGIAAALGLGLMRLVGSHEIVVAAFIGLVPGCAERSLKKIIAGALLGAVGYVVGAGVSAAIAKSIIPEVAFGHWAIVGAFVGLTAGMSRPGEQSSSPRLIQSRGVVYGPLLGLLFGFMGDIGGFFTVFSAKVGLFYYMREVSLLCAGVFINLGAGLAAMLAARRKRSEARDEDDRTD